jgi:hypothetical protein
MLFPNIIVIFVRIEFYLYPYIYQCRHIRGVDRGKSPAYLPPLLLPLEGPDL